MLDVGCGMGHFLYYLKNKGFKHAIGIDVSPEQVSWCRQNSLNVEYIENTLNYLKLHLNEFDMIIMHDVIEHFKKDEIVSILVALKNALKQGGKIVIQTPNMASFFGLYSRYIDLTHEIGFTDMSLEQILNCTGFKNVQVRGTKIRFGLKPKRFLRWILYKIWLWILILIASIEAGVNRPKVFERSLIATAST